MPVWTLSINLIFGDYLSPLIVFILGRLGYPLIKPSLTNVQFVTVPAEIMCLHQETTLVYLIGYSFCVEIEVEVRTKKNCKNM